METNNWAPTELRRTPKKLSELIPDRGDGNSSVEVSPKILASGALSELIPDRGDGNVTNWSFADLVIKLSELIPAIGDGNRS
ncbi:MULTISPECIES: hypothetical protein [Leptolyngbya]|uniref:hypothetical protein n=1 Tax=Leptolyngbya TaxID=47251 RepID=UPI001688EA7F|nr:hypothetical protein [Leptolyngbya sp. FACHB-1624]MBD1856201.1 hypothetical protein [Leptolyngbya sp. FACHB-1624]